MSCLLGLCGGEYFFNFAVENFPLVCDRVMTDSACYVGQQSMSRVQEDLR